MKFPALFPVGIMIIALLCLPVTAAESVPAMHNIEIRQAHLAWTALDKEVEMNAAIPYCNTLYGVDTTAMSGLLDEFRAEEARIPSAATDRELDSLIADMRNTTEKFRADTVAVMTKGQGDWVALNRDVSAAKINNPYILEKKETYWAVRKANQLADFDAWVQEGQQVLDTYQAGGYDTTSAQRALDVFSSRRPDVKAALESKNEGAIISINQQVIPLSEEVIRKTALVPEQVPEHVRLQFFIDQGYRAAGLADQANHDLVPVMIDIGDADPALSKTKTDLAESRKVLGSGNHEAAKIPLKLVQKDLTDLAQAYRDIVNRLSLSKELSQELKTLALRLETAADQMGASL